MYIFVITAHGGKQIKKNQRTASKKYDGGPSPQRQPIPLDWHRALVTNIHKKDEHYFPEKFQQISISTVSCKILEHIIVSTTMTHDGENM